MLTRNKKSKFSSILFFIILVILADLISLYFIKYHNQNLSIKEFNLDSFGNLANLLLTIVLILSILFEHLKFGNVIKNKTFLSIFVLLQLFLFISYLSTVINPVFKGIYFLGQNANRLLVASLFTVFNYLYFVLIFFVWLNIIKTKNLLLLRSMLNSALLMLAILIVVVIFISGKEHTFSSKKLNINKNSIGVVLGAAVWSGNRPSPSLSSRVDKAIELYDQGKISKIYLTGSNAPGELAESEVALNYIKSLGKNISDVTIEKQTTSTNEQIEFIKQQLLRKHTYDIIVISDSYHLVRVKEIGKFQNIKLKVIPSDLVLGFEASIYNKVREAIALTVFWFFAI